MNSKRIARILAAMALGTAMTAAAADWPMWGGGPNRNMVSDETGIPRTWDVDAKTNIKWVSEIGSQSYGNPVVADGKIFVGTNNERLRNPKLTGDRGVVMAFSEADGEFLWQMTHKKLESGRVNDWPEQGVCSSPAVVDGVVYYVSNRAEIIALVAEIRAATTEVNLDAAAEDTRPERGWPLYEHESERYELECNLEPEVTETVPALWWTSL